MLILCDAWEVVRPPIMKFAFHLKGGQSAKLCLKILIAMLCVSEMVIMSIRHHTHQTAAATTVQPPRRQLLVVIKDPIRNLRCKAMQDAS